MRVVYMGTPAFSIPPLELMLEGGFRVVGVYTQPDKPAGRGRSVLPSPVKAYAQGTRAEGVPTRLPETTGRL